MSIWDRYLVWDSRRSDLTMSSGETTTFQVTAEEGEAYLIAEAHAIVESGVFDVSVYHHPELRVGPVRIDSSVLYTLTIPNRPLCSSTKGTVVTVECVEDGTIRLYLAFQRGRKEEVESVKWLMEKEKTMRLKALELLGEPHLLQAIQPVPETEEAPQAPSPPPSPNLLPLLLLLGLGGG